SQAAELLDRFGLGEKRADYPDRLSGGQQQRVAIVRALAMRPRLMLLDEVTSALDPELVADVLDVIRELAEGGMTMLIATHEMGFARDIASRVCFLADGQIVEQGPPDRLFSEPTDERTRRFLRRMETPLRNCLRTETGSASVLAAATLLALIWANVSISSYERFWSTRLAVFAGSWNVTLDLHEFVNSGLMALFFFVVGLEARR